MMKTLLIALSAALMLTALVVADEDAKPADSATAEPTAAEETAPATTPETATTAPKPEKKAEPVIVTNPSGLRYQDVVVGAGKEAAKGMKVDSTGLVAGKRLQSSKDRGQTFTCTLGQNLIEGWSEGMVGMKEGGTRRLFVPWKLGYGERGMGSMIPAKADLVFEIDFVKAL
jgi:FKBP-type peptidyl-prolyl cis-trans isomerase